MSDNSKIVELDLNDILPNRFQPRIKFNEESIIELSESIKEHGVLQPIIVRPIGDKYEIVTGERRYKASVLAGLKTIPTRILDVNDKDSAEIALIENVQRKDLTPIEEAISYKKILDMGYLTQEQLATKLGRSQSTIANKIRLLNLCDEVQEALMEEKISERHARSLLRLEKAATQRDMLKRIISERLTVRKVDDEIKKILAKPEVEHDVAKENNDNLNAINSDVSAKAIEENVTAPKPSEDSDDIIDITDLFINLEDDNISTTKDLEKSSKEESSDNKDDVSSEMIKEKEKKPEINGENDNMMNNMQDMNGSSTNTFGKFFNASQSNDSNNSNNESNFVFNNNDNSSQNMMTNKMNDLLAPQGSSSSMFNTTNLENQDNIFSGLSVQPSLESRVDQSVTNPQSSAPSMFSNLMNNNQPDEYIDDNTFKDFLNPAYVDGAKQQNNPTNKSVIDSAVFAKFLDPEYEGSASKIDANNNIGLTGQNPAPVFSQFNNPPVTFGASNNTESPEMQTQNTNMSMADETVGLNSINTLENVTNQSQSFNGMLASEQKPDLLAPMGSQTSSSMSQASDIFSQGISTSSTPNPFASQFFAPTSEQPLTPDNIINTPESNPNMANESVISEKMDMPTGTDEQPIFITASNQNLEPAMPTSPIIDNPNISKLLEVDNQVSQTNNVEELASPNQVTPAEQIPATIAETANINLDRQVVGSFENQPIIITDYNKQYDPILPTDMVAKTPQIDFKQIINMIRDLNDKIESYGYEIDTEEYDLADLYQVIIKITKK